MRDQDTLALIMQCWVNTSLNREYRQTVTNMVRYIFSSEGLQSSAIDGAIEVVKIEVFDARIRQVLSDPEMINETFMEEAYALASILTYDRPWRQAFSPTRVYNFAIEALWRQIQLGSPEHTPEALHAGHKFFLCVFQSHASRFIQILPLSRELTQGRDPWSSITEDLVINTLLLEVIVEGLVIAERTYPGESYSVYEYVLKHI